MPPDRVADRLPDAVRQGARAARPDRARSRARAAAWPAPRSCWRATAGLRVWVTSRDDGQARAAVELGAHAAFESGARLPERVDAVLETVGEATWKHSLRALASRAARSSSSGATSGGAPSAELQRVFFLQLRVIGSTMGTRDELVAARPAVRGERDPARDRPRAAARRRARGLRGDGLGRRLRQDRVHAMSLYEISVFVHVSAVVVGFGATFAEAIMFPVAMKAGVRHLPFVHQLQLAINQRMADPALGLIIVTGIYQTIDGDWGFGSFWISATFADRDRARRHQRRLLHPDRPPARRAGPARDRRDGQRLGRLPARRRARGRSIGAVAGLLVIAAIFLMVTKPGA